MKFAAMLLLLASFRVTELPPLPRGIAGQLVGVASGKLVVAGGSWWTAPPTEGGTKIWVDEILTLEKGARNWRLAGHLPTPLAYGAAVQVGENLLLIGGQHAETIFRSVRLLRIEGLGVKFTPWPDLPIPLTNLSAARLGDRIYITGGQSGPSANNTLWSIDLAGTAWRSEPALPGPGRILASAAACSGKLYLLGGAEILPARRYLKEAWAFAPTQGWQKLPDLPATAVAAPAACDSKGNPLLLGGDDGSFVSGTHPGFSKKIFRLNSTAMRWEESGTLPVGLVTTGVAQWQGKLVIPGGEDKPGHRSPTVLSISLK